MSKSFLVTGATGKTGRATTRYLLEAGHSVRALARRDDERADALRALGAEVIVGDLLHLDDAIAATQETAGAFLCWPLAPGIVQATANVAEGARRADLPIVVNMSQISAREDARSHAAQDHWVAERVLDWSGVPTCHIRPTFFAEWLIFPWTRQLINDEGIIDLPFGEGRHAPIAAEDQARLIAAILPDPATHVGKTYTLHGPVEMDQDGIAAAMSEVLGRTVIYRPATIDEYRARLEKMGLPAFLLQHFDHVAVDYRNGVFAGEDGIIEEVTGKAPMTVAEFVSSNRAVFKSA